MERTTRARSQRRRIESSGPTSTARWAYSTAKAFAEVLANAYSYETDAKPVVTRLFNTVGPRQTGGLRDGPAAICPAGDGR